MKEYRFFKLLYSWISIRFTLFLVLSLFFFSVKAQFSAENIITACETCGPSAIFAADLDNDGDMDVLAASEFDNKVSWYKNTGGGTLANQRVITVEAERVQSIYAADLDGDGDVDVLSASKNDHKIAWYENLGGGVFGNQQLIANVPTSYNGISVYASDLDGDEDIDVLSAIFASNKIVWFENVGNGVFAEESIISTNANGAKSVHATDLDGDGDIDVLSASAADHKLAWYENLGDGVFTDENIISINATHAQSVFTSDLDGDEDMDVISISDNQLRWHENLDSGVFATEVIIFSGAVTAAYASDLDGDEDMDVVYGTVSSVKWMENLGGATFNNSNFYIGTEGESVHATDLDGDGDIDVLSASGYSNKIVWHSNIDNGTIFEEMIVSSPPQAHYPVSVTISDLDGDGFMDVLSAFLTEDIIGWFRNTGSGTFDDLSIINTGAGRFVYATDLDGDGDEDVLYNTSEFDEKIAWNENLGNGMFAGDSIISTNAHSVRAVHASDLDNDGDKDVLFIGGELAWFENLGAGAFSEKNIISNNVGYHLDVADLDGDGDMDVLNDGVYWYENLGGGAFSDQQLIVGVNFEMQFIGGVQAVDLDGDADMDILLNVQGWNLFGTPGPDAIWWQENLGDGNFANQSNTVYSGPLGSLKSLDAADMDGDGNTDLLYTVSSTIKWKKNLGEGSFDNGSTISTDAVYTSTAKATDLDNDGDMDVLITSLNLHKIAWHENLSPTAVTSLEKKAVEILVSPNPVKDFFNIHLPETITGPVSLQLFDIQGKLVFQRLIYPNEKIDTGKISAGRYTIKVIEEKKLYTGKLIKL